MNATRFYELSEAHRFAVYHTLDALGCEVHGPSGDGVCIALPRYLAPWDLAKVLTHFELAEVEGSSYWFPLGGDNPPKHMRHDGRYVGSYAFWRYVTFAPVSPLATDRAVVSSDAQKGDRS